jgi:hypothetical protein
LPHEGILAAFFAYFRHLLRSVTPIWNIR